MVAKIEERDQLILDWQAAERKLKEMKALETELRKKVIDSTFGYVNEDFQGTEKFNLGEGYSLESNFKQTISITKDYEKLDSVLTDIENNCEDGQTIAKELIDWKAGLNKKVYDSLKEDVKSKIDALLTTKPAKPTLKLKEPKK